MSSREILESAWNDEKVPLLNGLIYPDGRWIPMRLNDGVVGIEMECRWDVVNLEVEWTCFTELGCVQLPNSSLEVVVGEGGLGTDGAVAMIDRESNELLWILFSDTSNPFEHVSFLNGKIEVRNNLGFSWWIDMSDLGNVRVTSATANATEKR